MAGGGSEPHAVAGARSERAEGALQAAEPAADEHNGRACWQCDRILCERLDADDGGDAAGGRGSAGRVPEVIAVRRPFGIAARGPLLLGFVCFLSLGCGGGSTPVSGGP